MSVELSLLSDQQYLEYVKKVEEIIKKQSITKDVKRALDEMKSHTFVDNDYLTINIKLSVVFPLDAMEAVFREVVDNEKN